MDVEDEWELLSDDGFLEINDHGAANQIYSRNSSSAVVIQMNYFICPPPSNQFVQATLPDPPPPNRLLPPPLEIKMESLDQDPVSQVFFKKMRETEFVDMKVDSPKPSAVVPQIEANFQFEEEKGEMDSKMVEGEREDLERSGANVWKWSLNGIGAICSFGVAAATFCVIVFTTTANNKHHHHHNHKLHFRIYSDDKVVRITHTHTDIVTNFIIYRKIEFCNVFAENEGDCCGEWSSHNQSSYHCGWLL